MKNGVMAVAEGAQHAHDERCAEPAPAERMSSLRRAKRPTQAAWHLRAGNEPRNSMRLVVVRQVDAKLKQIMTNIFITLHRRREGNTACARQLRRRREHR